MPFAWFELFFGGLLGLCLGSLANVVAGRWHESASLWGRSQCPHCSTTIRPQHLVPILSWLMLGGRCADCKQPIHFQYPLVEFAGAVFGMIAALRHPFLSQGVPLFAFELFLSFVFLVVLVMDFRWKEVPVELVWGMTVAAAVSAFGFMPSGMAAVMTSLFLGILAPLAVFGFQWLISRGRWLGSGDIWVGMLIGAVLGWPGSLWAIYVGYLAGGVAAAIYLVARRRHRGLRMPFTPALTFGFYVVFWFSPFFGWLTEKYL